MSQGDKSYYDKVSDNLQNSLGAQTEGFKSTVSEHSAIRSNDNLSTGTKATALALNAVEVGVQAMGALGAIDTALESAILPVLGSLGMSGMACLPISKQLDPVMGIDVHLVTIPPSPAPIPMPHPYIGLLFRAKDFVAAAIASVIPPPPAPPEVENPQAPTNAEQQALNANKAMNLGHTIGTMAVGMLGATVKIGGVTPRAIAGTPTKSVPHFPMGAGFHASVSMIQKSVGHSFLGSMFTLADGDPLCGGTAHLHLSCNDVGIASPHDVRPSKNTEQGVKTLIRVFLPTSVVNPIPPSRQILTNPVPTPMNPVTAVKQLFKSSLGRFYKKRTKKENTKTTAVDDINDRKSQKNKTTNCIATGETNNKPKKSTKKKRKAWREHEDKVSNDLRAKGKKPGSQITLDVEGIDSDGKPFKTTIRVDNLHKTGKTFQITDAKHSSKKDLTSKNVNLRNTFTKNQKQAYDAIGGKDGAKVTSIKPRGANAKNMRLNLNEGIKVNNKIDIAVNNSNGGITYRTYP